MLKPERNAWIRDFETSFVASANDDRVMKVKGCLSAQPT